MPQSVPLYLAAAAATLAALAAVAAMRRRRRLEEGCGKNAAVEQCHQEVQGNAGPGCCAAQKAKDSHEHSDRPPQALAPAAEGSQGQMMPARMQLALERKQKAAAAAAPAAAAAKAAPPPPAVPPPTGPPPLGSIMALAKESGKSRKECKAALIASAHDYDAARWALMPTPPEADCSSCCAPPSAPVPGVFDPCEKFSGGRPGWLFKRGPLGSGYYRDAPMQVALANDAKK